LFYFVMTQSGNFWIHPRINWTELGQDSVKSLTFGTMVALLDSRRFLYQLLTKDSVPRAHLEGRLMEFTPPPPPAIRFLVYKKRTNCRGRVVRTASYSGAPDFSYRSGDRTSGPRL